MSPKLHQVRDRVRRAVTRQPDAPEDEEEVGEEDGTPDEPPARETLLRALERGRGLDHALISQVRALLAAEQHDTARSIGLSLREYPETETLGRLAGGIVAHREGFAELAWELLRPVPREAWTRWAVSEYVRSGLSVAPEELLAELRSLVADDPPEMRSKLWYDMLAPVFGYGESELARQIYERFDRHAREDENPWDEAERRREWMQPWVETAPDSPTAPSQGRRTFAVMDYGHPGADRASANIGDHVQSIASLGHLVRHQGVRLHGRDELVALLERLRERTRPERRLSDVDADLEVITVHRDASMYEAIPEDTWTLCFGWFMHALFGIRHGFPLHRNLRPIFVSFHCNKRGLLTPEAIEYLRRYGPVGCRDWNTVYLLLSLDVPAFFSGCLTTTIDTVFPDLPEPPPRDAPAAYVDIDDVPEDAVAYRHSDEEVRVRPFVANVERALELLETYRGEHRGVVTSRLHCYLPVRSIGVDVDFRPENRSDIRFDGLVGLDDGAFAAMREDIDGKLEQVFHAILSGRPEADVYALWRELTAAEVAVAKQRRHEGAAPAPVAIDLAPQFAAVREKTVTIGAPDAEAVHCAVVVPHGAAGDVSVLIASLLEHASRPLHVWLIGLPGSRKAEERLGERFPQMTFTRMWVRGLGEGLLTPDGSEPELETVARLLIADLLPDVDRLVVLPFPAVATADVAELADLDLGGHALAAPIRPGTKRVSGFGVIHDAALRLEDRTETSAALRRTAHARHRFDFDAFTHDVLVLDLARLRSERFGERALELVQEYGLDDLEVLHYLFGPEHADLPPRWAVVPTRMPYREPGLLYWADDVKPSQPELTAERELWRAYRTS
jgi:Glycosyl transferase family 8